MSAGEKVFWEEMVRAMLNLAAAAKSIAGVIRKHKLGVEVQGAGVPSPHDSVDVTP